ncbi:MAG: beta-glucosidase-like glycosyl hydrolase [Amycolatopsis sp.]|jgi:beta-glucosidase|uniref:glycoside hydrolase family 3 C-terminal domain-containing protein n=1 Tax=Amycolatopsis sp. TaxID=37632 RepID=UPI00261D64D8|nr:glycoside hydrolase family 3 C-terminal domain-containing protein [Amycolatopsis sp.]MCU1682804.1 beta-glucosidase-like glycosyl hydrolase [Amycolatopsis sp.]
MTDPVCPPGTAFAYVVDAVRVGGDIATAVARLVNRLTDDELLWLLDGDRTVLAGLRGITSGYNMVAVEAGRVDRLGIPGIRFTDGPRGVVMGSSTSFPASIARAAAWDTGLERAIGDAIGTEARALGANLFAGICVNLAYAPGWGRSQESYGEDPVLIGAMGAAMTEGVNPWVMSCVKHFALNSMEEARFSVDVQVADDVLHEVYLPHFRTVVAAGADCVMSAYNSVNGVWAGENRHLLTEVLRDDWGFGGFVMSDFLFGLRSPIESVAAGQDLEMPLRQQRARVLPAALADGRLARADVRTAATRILTAQVRLALRARPTPAADVVASAAHRELARDAARRGVVLLRNEQADGAAVLPFSVETLGRLAVVGRLAEQPNLGDAGSSKVRPPSTSSVLAGLRERLGNRVVHGRDLAAATAAARTADAAVVVVGLSSVDEGEAMAEVDPQVLRRLGGITRVPGVAWLLSKVVAAGDRSKKTGGDRRDLRLHADDVALVQAVAAVNPRTVVVVIAGGAVVLDPWEDEVAGILLAWYPGMEGGRAIADLLLGEAEPGGRLPVAIPRRREDLPVVDWSARTVAYGRWWGQRKLDRDGTTAAYPFGFGLGYTTFTLADLRVGPVEGERFTATVSVTNTGPRTGRHVVQIYAHLPEQERIVRALIGFQAVPDVASDESRTVTVDCTTRPLQRWAHDGFTIDHLTTVPVEAASWSGDPSAAAGVFRTGP